MNVLPFIVKHYTEHVKTFEVVLVLSTLRELAFDRPLALRFRARTLSLKHERARIKQTPSASKQNPWELQPPRQRDEPTQENGNINEDEHREGKHHEEHRCAQLTEGSRAGDELRFAHCKDGHR